MPYSSEIIGRASNKLEHRRAARAAEQRARQQEVYAAIPEVKQIDLKLRATVVAVAAAAFDHNTDPAQRIAQMREQNKSLQARRIELLTSHGYAADYLDDKPLCKKCEDRGWIGSYMCECLKTLCAEGEISSLSSMLDLGEQSFETFSLEWYSTDFNPKRGISDREQMSQVRRICQNYAEKFGKYVVHNLFLTGLPGLGKTFLSASIARVVCEAGYSVVYDTAIHIFSTFEAAKFGRDPSAEESTQRYLTCDLLILDDLGSELTTPMIQSTLYTIINTRLIEDKHTVISSNLTLEDIQERYQPMIASRIEGEYEQLEFVGEDIRKQRKMK
jgi:DNA replication protein DnaC